MNQAERIEKFVDEIWQWYSRHKRTLPWRDLKMKDEKERAYRILVSEIMLQQTQVPRVMVIYKRFLREFPTLRDLGKASNREVIVAWRGMGYNSRALRLRDAARAIVTGSMLASSRTKKVNLQPANLQQRTSPRVNQQRANQQPATKFSFPSDYEELLSIPGIGPYTAAAIRNFAFNIPTPCIDTNIRRILHRTFVGPENEDGTWSMSDRKMLTIAEKVLSVALDPGVTSSTLASSRFTKKASSTWNMQPANLQHGRTTADWHAALMDFGSMIQTKNSPKWNICPLTAVGIMKATPANFPKSVVRSPKSEPGRQMGGRYIPNRIFRGRIVDALRDAKRGLSFESLGQEICIEWSKDHEHWLKNLITKLVQDGFVAQKGKVFELRE